MICIWSSWCHCHPVMSCFIKIQIGFTFLVPAYQGCPGKEAVKWLSVCLSVCHIPRWYRDLESLTVRYMDNSWWHCITSFISVHYGIVCSHVVVHISSTPSWFRRSEAIEAAVACCVYQLYATLTFYMSMLFNDAALLCVNVCCNQEARKLPLSCCHRWEFKY